LLLPKGKVKFNNHHVIEEDFMNHRHIKTYIIFLLPFLLLSCSLLNKRRGHYDYLKKGVHRDDVVKKSGSPEKRSLLKGDIEAMVYGYCAAPYWKEAVFGILTFGMYTFNCYGSYVKMGLFFKDGKLVHMNGDINAAERAAVARHRSSAVNKWGQNNQRIQQEYQQGMDKVWEGHKNSFAE
jgi:hypothetical protein